MTFQLIKLGESLFAVKMPTGKMFFGNKFKVGDFCIDQLDADPVAMCETFAAFNSENKNYADFGINGSWTFIDTCNISDYLPPLPERGLS